MDKAIVGRSRFSNGGRVAIKGWYADGTTALHVLNRNGACEYTATVCVEGAVVPDGHVLLKGWSENEGVPEALVAAGIVELTGKTWPTGRVEALEARLLVEVEPG